MRLFRRSRDRAAAAADAKSGPSIVTIRAIELRPGMVLGDSVRVVDVQIGEGDTVDPNAAPVDRSAGRFCATCERHGSHHSDTHAEFMRVAMVMQSSPTAPLFRSYLSGTESVDVRADSVPA